MSSLPKKENRVTRFDPFRTFAVDLPDVTNQAAMQQWYTELKRTLQRISVELGDPVQSIDDRLTTAEAALASAQTALSALQAAPAAESCCDELRQAIDALTARIAALESATPPDFFIEVQDDGVGQGTTKKLNFTGNVVATVTGNTAEINVPASVSSGSVVTVTIVAAVNIAAFDPVTSLGKIADSANPSQGFGKVIGLATAAIASTFSGDVLQDGPITNPAWTWTVGDVVYLNGTGLSTSPPATGFSQRIGTAVAPTILVVELSEPVML